MVRVWAGYGLYDPRWGLYRQEESLPVIPVPSDLLDAVPGARVGRPMRTFVPDFVATICGEERPMLPTFYEGMKAQEVLDAVLLSADQRRWVDLPL
jgi:predicted dehydrogenase